VTLRSVLVLGALLAGCPTAPDPEVTLDDDDSTEDPPLPIPGSLDTSELPDGRVGDPYAGRLRIADYDGPVVFSGGPLPPGLSLAADGSVTGLPIDYGLFDFFVVAEGMDGVLDTRGRTIMRIRPPQADGPFLGFARTYPLGLWRDLGLLRDPWLRVAAEGGGPHGVFVLEPGAYEGGPDGEATAGLGDDVLTTPLGLDEVEVLVGEFEFTEEVDPAGGSYPSGHYNEGSAATWEPQTASFVAGSDTGRLPVEIRHPELGSAFFDLYVLAPSWCPSGSDLVCE